MRALTFTWMCFPIPSFYRNIIISRSIQYGRGGMYRQISGMTVSFKNSDFFMHVVIEHEPTWILAHCRMNNDQFWWIWHNTPGLLRLQGFWLFMHFGCRCWLYCCSRGLPVSEAGLNLKYTHTELCNQLLSLLLSLPSIHLALRFGFVFTDPHQRIWL